MLLCVFHTLLSLTIGFGLGVGSLQTIDAETGPNDVATTARQSTFERRGYSIVALKVITVCTGVREKSWLATMQSG